MAIMERREARRTIISCSTPTNSPIALLLKYYLTLLLEKNDFEKPANYDQLWPIKRKGRVKQTSLRALPPLTRQLRFFSAIT